MSNARSTGANKKRVLGSGTELGLETVAEYGAVSSTAV